MKVIHSPLKKGQIIRKNSYDFFGLDKGITMTIKTIRSSGNPKLIVINGISLDPTNVTVIDQEEADALLEEFRSLDISPADSRNLKSSCVREDNGEPKTPYSSPSQVLRVLWVMKKKYPDKDLEAYECTYCNKFHVGKVKPQESSDNLAS